MVRGPPRLPPRHRHRHHHHHRQDPAAAAGAAVGAIFPVRLRIARERIMIDKISGQVAYAVMSFGGFLGMGTEEQAIPWNKLTYDTSLEGFRTDITEQQLRGAPAFS